MPTLVTAILARNEADPSRFLGRVLARCAEFSDTVLVLDDHSTDSTVQIAQASGAVVRRRASGTLPAWGSESAARSELWDFATEHCPDISSWVLFCDADMILEGDPRPLIGSREANTFLMRLYDVWDEAETVYRADSQFWRGHEFPRPWLVAPRRVPEGWSPEWSQRGVHPGHLPLNWPLFPAEAPSSVFWKHLAYSSPQHRQAKYEQYMAKADQLSPFELAHVESILR